jgi:D-3-phosphoglycerate dehydrogenase
MYTIVVTDDRHGNYDPELAVFDNLHAELRVCNLPYAESSLGAVQKAVPAETVEVLSTADAVLVNLFPLTRELINLMERCRVISRYGSGYDNVDVDAATEKGIYAAYVPGYATEDVSDHALALLLDCIRGVSFKDRSVRDGSWDLHSSHPTRRIAGKTLGLVGFGRIGTALRRKVAGLGLAEVLVFDPYLEEGRVRAAGARPADFKTLLAESDYISVHAPSNRETYHLFDTAAFSRMKKGSILINTSRGGLVDESALAEALTDGTLACAGLDVYEQEPLPPDSLLRALPNIVLTDHTAFYSAESFVELKQKAARNVAEVLLGGKPLFPLNSLS